MNPKRRRCLYIYALLSIFFFNCAHAQNWQPLGPDDNNQASFSYTKYTSMVIDGAGSPYLVFRDTLNNNKATVRKFHNNAWTSVGTAGFSTGRVAYTSIDIDGIGIPYVVYKDEGNNNKATVKKFNGSAWVNVGTEGFSAGTANYTRIAIDRNGIPYVVYSDEVNNGKATVLRFNGSSWVTVGTAGFSAGEAAYTYIAIDGSNTPYVIYQDGGNNNYATVKKFDGNSWINVGPAGFSGQTAAYTSLALDRSNTPYVVYQVTAGGTGSSVKKFDGSAWIDVGNILITVANPSIAIDSSGTPYVAGGGMGYANLSKFNGIFWMPLVVTAIEDFSALSIDQTLIAIDARDTVYLSYHDDFLKKMIVKKVTGPNKWVTVGTTGFTPVNAAYISMAVFDNSYPYVIYRDFFYKYTYVVKFDSTTWRKVGQTVFGRTETTPAIVVGPGDTPYALAFLPQLVVKKYNGSAWADVGKVSAVGASGCLAISNNGIPYVGFADFENGGKVTVKQFNGNNWVNTGTPGFSTGIVSSLAFAIDSTGTPYIAYRDEANNSKTTVKKFDGSSWVDVGAPSFSAGAVNSISLAIDTSGIPYVAYVDQANGNKATVQKFNGLSWVTVGAAGFSTGAVAGTSLAIKQDGTPYVTYVDSSNNNRAAVMQFDGSKWVNVSGTGLSAGPVSTTRIGIGTNGAPVVTYGFNDAFARSLVSIPMHLAQFRGLLLNKNVHLMWRTVGDENESPFIVERSVDGRNFIEIGTVAAHNRITGFDRFKFLARHYNFIDRNIASLNESILYYRLRQEDNKGNIILSKTVTIRTGIGFVHFFPNPFNKHAFVRITANKPQAVEVRIFDCAGRLMLSQHHFISSGSTSLRLDMNHLGNGIYFLQIKGLSIDKQIIIQKQ